MGGLQLPPPAPASTFCNRGSTAREAVQIKLVQVSASQTSVRKLNLPCIIRRSIEIDITSVIDRFVNRGTSSSGKRRSLF
jgi:hypothetical protein